jgi:hypothetical protein
MYLMDAIAATAARVGQRDGTMLDIFPDIASRMHLAPRYLLDASVMRASVELGMGRPSVFREAMRHLQVPYPRMWVEWPENSRDALRRELDPQEIHPLKPVPSRLGFLIEADDGGRSGNITWAWSSPAGKPSDVPNISPYDARFDLDGNIQQSDNRIKGMLVANLARPWLDNPVQLDALLDIWRTSDHRMSNWGRSWVQPAQAEWFITDVYGEYIEVWAILLLLTASRPTVDYKPVCRDKLNRARTRKRVVPLFDHTEITMHVEPRTAIEQARGPLNFSRKPPRIHYVSRYLARRGDKHWLVNPYIRGRGEWVTRHTHVKA